MNQEQTRSAEETPAPKKKRGCLGCFIKGTAVIVLLLLVAVGVTAAVIGNRLDEIARRLVEQQSSSALGVTTTVEEIDIALFAGTCEIDNVNIDNAPDFQDEKFLQLEYGEVALALPSLREDMIELPYLRLNGVEVYVERKNGKANYEYIIEHVEQSRDEPEEEPTQPGAEKRFVIREMVIDDVTVHVTTDLAGGTRDQVVLPTIKMTDVGSDTDYGAKMSEITDIIVRAILATLVKKGVGELPAALLTEMEGQLQRVAPLKDMGIETIGELGGAAQDLIGGAGRITESLADPNKSAEQKARDVTDTVRDTAEQTGDRVREGAGNIIEGIGGTLRGGSSDENKTEESN